MEWNEIPKLKEYGIQTHENIGFVKYIERIEEEVEKYNLELTPDFQRGHIWTEEQQVKYMEFFLMGGKSGRDFYFNLNDDSYVLVDGLQRTTAIWKFVNNQLKVFGQYYTDFHFTKYIATSNPLPEFTVNIYRNNLATQREILEWYVDMNSGGTPHSSEEIERVKEMIDIIKEKRNEINR